MTLIIVLISVEKYLLAVWVGKQLIVSIFWLFVSLLCEDFINSCNYAELRNCYSKLVIRERTDLGTDSGPGPI